MKNRPWLGLLAHNGRRWRPYTDDPNAMHMAGISVRDWVHVGLQEDGYATRS